MEKIEYIDLFAGIGGFHQAFDLLEKEKKIKAKCVFASEIDKYAIESYKENYNLCSDYDITKVQLEEKQIDDQTENKYKKLIKNKVLDSYNMLCAGFPCQSFSKAGSQKGFKDEIKGTLFFHIVRLLEFRVKKNKPVKYILLENVSNLVTHDKGNTWKVIKEKLKRLGYVIPENPIIISPHQIGVPQLRNRVFIAGVHESFHNEKTLDIDLSDLGSRLKNKIEKNKLYDILEKKVSEKYSLNKEEKAILELWDDFYRMIDIHTLGYPIWYSELNKNEIDDELPSWKKSIIKKNRDLYKEKEIIIEKWKKTHFKTLSNIGESMKKFEWQAGGDIKNVFEGIIQFRPSGVRVKRPTEFPALVAMVHIPIIGKEKRRLTPREVARLQSFPESYKINSNEKQAYKQFGNSVNVLVVKYLINKLLFLQKK